MPFDLDKPELGAVAAKVILEFVRYEHPDQFEKFLKGTGKNEEEWKRTVAISHNEFIKLQNLLYGIWGKVDPWRFDEVGIYITHTDNLAVTFARLTGSAAAVVAKSDTGSNPKLNIDSRLEVLTMTTEKEDKKTIGKATILHLNFGFVDQKYLTAPITSAGYLRGIPTLWGFEPMDVKIKMVDQNLEDILKNEFGGIRVNLNKDEDGNYIENGRIVAKAVIFSETPYGILRVKTRKGEREKPKIYAIKEGEFAGKLFVGNPGVKLGLNVDNYEEIQLDSLDMHYIEEDIYGNDEKGNQILIAKGGTYFGGPFSIYDIKWEERPVNWLLRWWFKQKERKRSESSRDIMHEIARRETLQRAKAEEELKEARKQLDNYITEIAERTSREHQLIEERKKLQLDIRGQLHDIAHQFIDLRARTYVGLASVLWMAITDLPEEKISFLFNDASISPIPQTGDELVRRVKKTLSKDQVDEDQSVPIDILKIRDLSEILLENTDGLRHEGLLRDFLSEANKIRDSCSSGDQYCRNLMNSFEAEPYQRLNLRELWDNASERIRGSSKGGLARFEYSASEDVFIEGDEKRLTLTLENLIANALKANKGVKTNPYVKVEMQREDTRVRYILQNSVAWKSEGEMQQVVTHANSLSNQRFSTDNPKGGLGMVYIKGTIRDHGGSYSASGDYEKGEFRQVIELPIIN